jgi:hypothetical protein
MKPVLWMTIGSIVSGLAIGALTGMRTVGEIWLGMLAPLAVVSVSWILTERVYRQHPERLTGMMIGAFAGKLVFFGVYVGLVIGMLRVQPVPFVVSLTSYFIVLHLIEALWLKRLFAS